MTLPALLKFNLRYYRRHRLLSLLCLMGISLGVGIVVAVELINNSALSSLSASVDFLSGRATHSLVSGYGRIDEKLFAKIWRDPTIEAASPVVEVMAEALETGGEPIRFIGLDPFLDADFRTLTPREAGEQDFIEFLANPLPSAFLSPKLADRFGLKKGGTLTVLTAGIEKKVLIIDSLPKSADVGLGDSFAVMDVSSAQEVFGRQGYLDRIDIIYTGDAEELTKRLPTGIRLTDRSSRKFALKAMLYSFQLNLAAMSLLALFVGIFLIYNFSMFSVLSRRENMSLLLTLGADRKGLVFAFLMESLLLGTAGSLIGILFGYAVAWWSIDRVSSTISELYFYVRVESIRLTLPVVLSGFGVGYLATILGTGLPALEVAVTPPILGMKRQSIEDRAHGLKGFLLAAGVFCFLGALVSAWASRFSISWGFVSAFGMTLAFALFTPAILSPFTHYVGIYLRKGFGLLEAFLAARTIRASLSRTSMAVAALAVALSMTIGVDTMIHSFRESVADWLEGSIEGNLYISPATTKWDHPLPADLIRDLKSDSRLVAVERYSTYEVFVKDQPVRLRVVDGSVLKNHSRFRFLQGEKSAWDSLIAGGIFISESLAYRLGLSVEDRVVLATPEGDRSFSVVSIIRDYSSDQGAIHMDREIYERLWKDDRVQSVALFLKSDASVEEIRQSIVKRYPGLDRTIASNTKMKDDILVIFDKTFAPTATLKGVSLLVALLGVATALMAILLERTREMIVLGYLGLTRREMGKMNVYQALVMGFAAFAISILCGLILTYIIIYAINYRSFGWSVDIHVNPWIFAKGFVLTMLACFVSALYPTYKLMREPAALSLEEE